MGMIVPPTSATVGIPNTAVVDSSCLGSRQCFDYKPECVDSVEGSRMAVDFVLPARVSKGPSTVKLAKVKESSDQFQN